MNEQQVRDRVTAAADTIDCSPVPLTTIRSTGRTFVRRRRRVRVVGYAAAILSVVGLAVAVPTVAARNDEPTTATEAPSTGPGVGDEVLRADGRRALRCRNRTTASR